jgi:hypothetical protein
MLTQRFTSNFRKIAFLAVVTCAGLATVSFALPASQSTYTVAASQSSHVTPKTNCNAKADKLNTLMGATAPVVR